MTPSPERAELTAALRDLKQASGLSLTGLEERTPFSKSSWGRYLKGETLPPREAVRELCRLAGRPEGRCLALWELAESETSGRAAAPLPRPEPPGEPEPSAREPARHGAWRIAAVTAAVLSATVAAALTAALLLPGQTDRPGDVSSTTARTPAAGTPSPPGPRCRDAACEARDPMNMLCGTGPRTISAYRTATGARLELRHSPRCGASWARMWSTHVGDLLELTAAGHTHSAEVVDALDARNYLYTPMAATGPGTLVRACFRPATKGPLECFEATVR